MERTLATIQKIVDVQPIDGADKIDKVSVLGWHVVSKKGEFNIGDSCVFIEIDSVLPPTPEFEFLKDVGYRIRTRKFKKQVSQGICFPISILPPEVDIVEGADVTEILGITKWELQLPVHLAGLAKGNFPGFIPKTDEIRIQSVPWVLEKYVGIKCYYTEKMDGTSISVYFRNGTFGVCSRRLDLKDTDDNIFWNTVRKLDLDNKLRTLGKNVAIQGELIGPGIQKNKYNLKDYKIYWYNVFNIDTQKYLDFGYFNLFITSLSCETVPILNSNLILQHTVDDFVILSSGKSKLGNNQREGIVIRPIDEIIDDKLGRLSFKVVNPDFLLQHNE